MSTYLTKDNAKFIGNVAEWLETAPEAPTEYGGPSASFYVTKVVLAWSGEDGHDEVGEFVNDDPDWIFVKE